MAGIIEELFIGIKLTTTANIVSYAKLPVTPFADQLPFWDQNPRLAKDPASFTAHTLSVSEN